MEQTPVRERLAARFEAELRELVMCESPSDDVSALERSAATVARIGESYLGRAPEVIVVDDRPHLRWRFGARSRVLVLGHHDTVWPLGTLDDFPWASDGARAEGPGSFDMKAGLLQAFAALASLPDRDGVTVLVTADEELGAPTSRELIEEEARRAGTTLVFEASADGGAVKTGRKGMARYELVVTGKAAHAGLEPWKGVNATVEIAALVPVIAAMTGGATETTVTPTLMASGTTGNTVPHRATLVVDVRAISVDDQARVRSALEALRPIDPRATIEVVRVAGCDPLEPSHSTELYDLLLAAATEHGLPVPASASVGGASDGNIAAGAGSRVLDGLGAVGAGAHAPGEYVLIPETVDRSILVGHLMQRILAS
jgi:glutamate carboxypeptidase